MDENKVAKEIFKAIEDNLKDRRGIGNEWEMCDEDVQKEIRSTNQKIISKILKKHLSQKKTT